MRRYAPLAALAATISFTTSAAAHTGHNAGFAIIDGLSHPVTGMDHLLAMVAVGFWAALIGGRALIALPFTFVLSMAIGALLAAAGYASGGIEAAVLGSVIVLGAAIALRLEVPLAVAVGITALFALAHGQAHGLEVPDSASLASYIAGFAIATTLLHIGGVVAGRMMVRVPALTRVVGAAISAAGVVLAAG